MSAAEPIVRIANVVKSFGQLRVLDGVSFCVEPGELVAYIGPNGAGKSTTVKILAGILVPSAGRCLVLGRVPWRERIGWLPSSRPHR